MSEILINFSALVANIAPFTFADSKQMKVQWEILLLILFLGGVLALGTCWFVLRC